MARWWIGILLLMLGVLILSVVGWHYGPWLQNYLAVQSDVAQSLEAAFLVLAFGVIFGLLWRYWPQSSKEKAENPATVGGSVSRGNIDAGGNVAGRNINNYNIQYGAWQGEPARSDSEALAIYHEVLAQRCGDIPLTGLDRDADDAGSGYRPLGLERVYVDLDTEMTVSEKALQTALAAGQPLISDRSAQERAEDLRPLSALEATALHPRLVLLGAPGSGKTTFVNRLCLALARNEWQDLKRWPAGARHRLPVLVILRDFARWLKNHDKPPEPAAALIWDYIKHDLQRHNLSFAESLIETALDENAQVFLDGLDEVPPDTRQVVLDTINKAFTERYPKASVLITCRVASYEQAAWRLPQAAFPTLTLAPFDDKKIQHFVTAWYEEMAQRWNQSQESTRKKAAKLTEEALSRPDLARLAPNPLLLTVMALVHTHETELPDHRVDLYESCVKILLWRWERRKQDSNGELDLLTRLRQAGCDKTDLLRELRRLAFEAHEQGGASDDPEQVTGIDKRVLIEALASLHDENSWDWAKSLVELMCQRTGLLVEREPGVFTFPHRTFQEYLAGVYLARQRNFITRVSDLVECGAFWREVILLGAGYKVHRDEEYDLIFSLIDDLCPAATPTTEVAWRKVHLAGDIVLEMGVSRAERQRRGRERVEGVRNQMAALIEQGQLDPSERAQAGEVLGALGDPRFGPEQFYLPCLYQSKAEPRFGFVEIPKGSFWMGSEKGDPEADKSEFGNDNPLKIPYDYWIARYPVTVAQFGVFLKDGGYANRSWWQTDAAQRWLQESERRIAPRNWEAQCLHPNRPVVYVTWYETMAYCAWLDATLRSLDNNVIPPGYQLRLPSEAEWEKAARSGGQVRYPWRSEDWDKQRANIRNSAIGHPTPVGIYPQGATPSGLHDLAGNVFEWTLTAWGDYPYKSHRNNPEVDAPRVVRGGSWDFTRQRARCASRGRLSPGRDWFSDRGFRVVLSLADSVF